MNNAILKLENAIKNLVNKDKTALKESQNKYEREIATLKENVELVKKESANKERGLKTTTENAKQVATKLLKENKELKADRNTLINKSYLLDKLYGKNTLSENQRYNIINDVKKSLNVSVDEFKSILESTIKNYEIYMPEEIMPVHKPTKNIVKESKIQSSYTYKNSEVDNIMESLKTFM